MADYRNYEKNRTVSNCFIMLDNVRILFHWRQHLRSIGGPKPVMARAGTKFGRKIDRKHFHVNYVEYSTPVDAKTLRNSEYELN